MSLIAAGAPIEIMCLERVRIELDGPLEFCTITNVSRSTPVLPLPSLCRILNKMCGDRVTTLVDEPRIVVEVDLPFRSEPQLLLWRCELGDKGVRPGRCKRTVRVHDQRRSSDPCRHHLRVEWQDIKTRHHREAVDVVWDRATRRTVILVSLVQGHRDVTIVGGNRRDGLGNTGFTPACFGSRSA